MWKRLGFLVLSVLMLAVGCESEAESTPTVPEDVATAAADVAAAPTPIEEETEGDSALPSEILISEVLLGVPGNNQQEFIELYNAEDEALSLDGWSLWYRLNDSKDEELVIAWEAGDAVPGLGHYLLVREEQEVGVLPDAVFAANLSERKGGLVLRSPGDDAVDKFGWGEESPDGYYASVPVTAVADGPSLERLPGGEAGNQTNSFDNSADFAANAAPNPQNSGSLMTPFPADTFAIRIDAPDSVTPAQTFEYQIAIENLASVDAESVLVSVPVADGFTVLAMPEGGEVVDGRIQFTISQIPLGETANAIITLESPITYADTLVGGYYAEADDLVRAYGPLRMLTMSGGSIPIATARTLAGSTVSVEGVATMYTGGLYAGSTGTKFYLEDETGGVQIFVPGGIDDVVVAIGDRVRATGVVTPYRDSIEIIPDDFTTDIEIMEQGAEWEPTAVAIGDYKLDDAVIGLLTTIEGTAVRIEEFSYSYEMDIADDAGNITLLYIDKLTAMSAEPYDVGRQYRIVGISEFYSGQYQIYPRRQSDIAEVFPPVLAIELDAPNSIPADGALDVTITVHNYTAEVMTNVQIRTNLPEGADLAEILDGEILESGTIFWNIGELAGDGGTASVSYHAVATAGEGEQIVISPARAAADQWPTDQGSAEATTAAFSTFVGDGVPIWAIQGDGPASPYVRTEATTVGVVTAVFPDLGGFWLQTLEPDSNPLTSDGLFVLLEELPVDVAEGDLLQITGRVREISGQTTLHPQTAEAIVKHGEGYIGTVEPVAYDPPQDVAEALAYMESLEGMLVVAETAVVIAPTTKYGESVLVAEKWGVDQIRRGEEVGFLIFTDDGSSMTHLDQSTLPYVITLGDVVANLVGPLAFTFDNYKIELMEEVERVGEERPLPTLPETGPNQLSIATFNVENFFDNRDPHPSDPPRPTKAEYALKLNKIAEAIVAMGAPTIVGLQEVENIDVLEALVVQEQLAAYSYVPYLIEGSDGRGIDVAYIVRGDRATVESADAFDAPDGLTSRPPLLINVTVHLDSGDQTVYVLNNHFSSLSSGEAATEPRRTGQAAWNVTVMEQVQATDPDAQFVVMGDLNSFWHTRPLDTLEEAGLRHVYDWFGDEPAPYTYIYQGKTQTLDHILVSDSLFAQLEFVDALHINAGHPLAAPDDATARRVSDHDPLVAVFTFEE